MKSKADNQDQKMNEVLNKLFDKMAVVSLSAQEKQDLYTTLESFADEHDTNTAPHLSTSAPVPSPFVSRFASIKSESVFGYLSFFKQKKFIPVGFVALFMLIGGSSFVAQFSLPGDILYPIKIHLNEQVGSLLALGPQAHAVAEVSHAEARLAEAEKLSSENKLSSSTQAVVKEQFSEKIKSVTADIDTLKASGDVTGAVSVSSDLEATLGNHENVLLALSEKGGDQSRLLSDLAGDVTTQLKVTTKVRVQDESALATSTNSDIKASAQDAQTSAQNKIAEVNKYISDNDKTIDANLKTQALADMDIASTSVAQGNNKITAGNFADAFILFRNAFRRAQRVQLMLNSQDKVESVLPGFLKISHDDDTDIGTNASTTEAGIDGDIIEAEPVVTPTVTATTTATTTPLKTLLKKSSTATSTKASLKTTLHTGL